MNRRPFSGFPWVAMTAPVLMAACLLLGASESGAQEGTVPSPYAEAREQETPATSAGGQKDVHELLVLANSAYEQGNYEEAARGYEAIIAAGIRNGHIYYNLGNCDVRLDRIGKAIQNYRKAQLLTPRDGDLQFNLKYARSLRKGRVEEQASSLWHTLAFWYYAMNFRELLVAFCILNLLFWTSLLIWLFRSSEWIRWTTALTLLLSIVLGTSAFLKYRETLANRDGVILAKEAPVRAGLSHDATVRYVFPEGTEFRILGQEDGWWKIELPDGKRGWIPSQSGGVVSL